MELVRKAKTDDDTAEWVDTGCEFEDRCLSCERPIEQCPACNRNVYAIDRLNRQTAEIKSRIADGQTYEQIAGEMGISVRTVFRLMSKAKEE